MPAKRARRLLLSTLVKNLKESEASRLTIERHQSLIEADRRTIRHSFSSYGYLQELVHQHTAPADHAMLWVSDAVAWCYQAGGDWIRRAGPLVFGITRLR